MRLGIVFAVLVAVNIYVFFFRGGTSIHDVLQASAIEKNPVSSKKKTGSAAKKGDDSWANQGGKYRVRKGSMKGHLGLSTALAAQKLEAGQVEELIEALRPALNMRALKPEQTFEIHLDPHSGQVQAFRYRISSLKSVVVQRQSNGGLRATTEEKKLVPKVIKIGGTIESSLNQAMADAGESAALVASFVDLFSWDINWYSDPRPNDEFRIVVEKNYLDGKFHSYGRIMAAEYQGAVGRLQAFYHRSKDGTEGHYLPEGRSVRRTFLKTPLHFRRVSSKFNAKRFHPVLHRTKGHFGVDYAAPKGTPIWAAADGVVTKAGRYGGAGNMIVLQHDGGVQTIYMHLSRFARGLKAGKKVTQRSVIGYVGTTGLSTGPHLHYGIKVRGKHVDPLKFDVGKGKMLPRAERIRFMDTVPKRMSELEAISTTGAVAKADH